MFLGRISHVFGSGYSRFVKCVEILSVALALVCVGAVHIPGGLVSV